MSIYDLEKVEPPDEAVRHLEKIRKTGFDQFETKHHCKDGSTIDVDMTVNYLDFEDGKFYSFIRDITEKKAASRLIEKEREKLLKMFDSIEDFVYVSDPETNELLFTNDAMKKAFGEDIVGQKCYKVIQGRNEQCPFCTNEIIYEEEPGKPHIWEFQNEINERWYRCVDKAIYWSSDRLVRLEFASDITDLKIANDNLVLHAADLRKANADLEQFAYFISHDLKEPLRSISGFCQLIQKKYTDQLDDRGQKYLNMVVDSSNSLASMIDTILDYSRISREKIEREDIDTMKLLKQVEASLAGSIRDSKTEIHYENVDDIHVDRTQFGRIFQNLILNSIRYSGEAKPRIVISVNRNKNVCLIQVKDNGIGFDERHAEAIFQPFKRLPGKKEIEGSGMGLTICKKIVDLHSGRIWAESAPDKGTTINIEIPTGGNTNE